MTNPERCPEIVSEVILSQLNLGTTLGTLNIGVSLSAVAYGITCCQLLYYYRSNKAKRDSWSLKAFVAFLFVLVTFQQILTTATCYDYLVSHYDDPCALLRIVWPVMTSILLECIIGGFVKCFLTHRVWSLGHSYYVVSFCSVVVAADFALSLVISVQGYQNPSVFATLSGLQSKAIASWGTSVLADMCIGVSIILYLYRSRRGIRRSDDIISKLMLLTVATGLLTTIVMIVGLALNIVYPDAYYSVTIEFVLGELYMNSLLTTLNVRDTILARPCEGTTGIMNTVPLSGVGGHIKGLPTARVNVCIDHTVESDQTHIPLGSIESKHSMEKKIKTTGSDASDAEEMC